MIAHNWLIIDRVDEVNSLKRSRAIQFIDGLAEFEQLTFHRVDNERHNYQHLVAFVQNDKRDQFINKLSATFPKEKRKSRLSKPSKNIR